MQKLTVSELTKAIKTLITDRFPDDVKVVGEISNLSISTSGHCYFSLKDENAQIKCVFFKGYLQANKDYKPKNGDKVVVVGEITVYEKEGNYQILVKKVEYDSVGDFYKRFEETKRKLEKEGLFDSKLKKEIPFLSRRVAVISSPSGAAIKDFIRTLKKNNANILVDLWPAPVQGEDAIPVIISILERLNGFVDFYDVVVLMRGGGSLEDLAIFNDEQLARSFFACEIPTISAIGHERDFTICDFVADLRVATPTAAAEKLSEDYLSIEEKLTNLTLRLKREMRHRLNFKIQEIDTLEAKLNKFSPLMKIKKQFKEVEYLEKAIYNIILEKKFKIQKRLTFLIERLSAGNPAHKIELYKSNISNLLLKLENYMVSTMRNGNEKVDKLVLKLNLLNPENILEKGYAIVFKDESPVGSVKNIHLDDELEIRMKDGYISSFVTAKKNWRK